MRKDAPLAFRIPADLKKGLLRLARLEARSLSQVCEMLLKIGVEEYDREGHKYMQRVLNPPRNEDQSQSEERLSDGEPSSQPEC
jgi:hypothetical protein